MISAASCVASNLGEDACERPLWRMDGQRDAVWGTWPSAEEPLTHEAIHGHQEW